MPPSLRYCGREVEAISNRLEGKTAIVTGGALGIGQGIAEILATEGARVLITDIEEEAGNRAVELIRTQGGAAEFCRCDVSNRDDVARAVARAEVFGSRIDILVNNAAYTGKFHDTLTITDEEWDLCLDVALMGTFHFTRAVLPSMIDAGRGSIINISSIQGLLGYPNSVAYTSVKAALIGFTRSVAADYGKHNIRVNAICPGPIQTRISPKPGEPLYVWQSDRTMLGRVGYPKDVAYAAAFLASDESCFITAAVLPVDGGWTGK